jgi:hypothetical protein
MMGDPDDINAGQIRYDNNINALQFEVNAGERLRITSAGKLFLHGTGATSSNNTTTRLPNGYTFNIHGNSSEDGISIVRYNASYGAYGLNIGRSRNNTIGTNTAVQDNNELGHVSFYGADGTDFNMAAQITGVVDGTPSDGTDMPGALVFKTSAEASATPTERLRIESDGNIKAKSGTQFKGFHLVKADGGTVAQLVGHGSDNDEGGVNLWDGGTKKVQILANGYSYLNGGFVGIGTNSPAKALEVTSNTVPQFQVGMSNNSARASLMHNGSHLYFDTTSGDQVFRTGSTSERLRITSTGLHKITTPGNTADGTYFSTITINNTGSSTWSRLRFDRGGVAKWGLALGTDDKFRISNLYTNGSSGSPDDDTFVISNSGNIDMSGYLKAKPSSGNGNNQLAKGRNYTWNQTNLSPDTSAGLESGWYPIMDISDGQYLFLIATNAHNSATCLVTNGYDPSAVSRINVLNCVRNNNSQYLNIQEIRVLNNGVVEVYLYASTPLYFGMYIQMISNHNIPNFYSTLTKNTGSPTVDDSKDFYTYSSSVGSGLMHVENLRVDGTISKGTDNFEIPHPLPSKKDTHHLFHSMIEGPQCDNIYRGKVTLSSGAATVNLDTVSNMTEGTFVLLNRDVQCFTTNETGWGAIKGSVSGNILTISAQDGSSTDTISWMVVGERQDDAVKKSNSTDSDGHLVVERDVSSHDDDLTGDTLS